MRLNLPVQGSIERRWNFYEPYLEVVRTYEYKDEPKGPTLIGHEVGEPPPAENFGSDVSDPGPSADYDTRGWSCQPVGGCTWVGLI